MRTPLKISIMMFISQLSPFWEVLSMKLKIALSNSKWSILLFNIFGLNQRCYWLVNMRSRLPRSGKFFPSKRKSRIQETNWLIWFIHQLSYLNFFVFSKYVPSKKNIFNIYKSVWYLLQVYTLMRTPTDLNSPKHVHRLTLILPISHSFMEN